MRKLPYVCVSSPSTIQFSKINRLPCRVLPLSTPVRCLSTLYCFKERFAFDVQRGLLSIKDKLRCQEGFSISFRPSLLSFFFHQERCFLYEACCFLLKIGFFVKRVFYFPSCSFGFPSRPALSMSNTPLCQGAKSQKINFSQILAPAYI